MKKLEGTAAKIETAYSEIATDAFPYEDCRSLSKEMNDDSIKYIIPDLDLYFSMVASHAIGVHSLLQWTASKASESRQKLSRSFFELHPQYEQLRSRITPDATPMLHQHLMTIERVRNLVLDLLAEIEAGESSAHTP
jgi:hypothetical protein